jgi:hypothetical protein
MKYFSTVIFITDINVLIIRNNKIVTLILRVLTLIRDKRKQTGFATKKTFFKDLLRFIMKNLRPKAAQSGF